MSLGDFFKTTAAGDVPFNATVTPQGRQDRRTPGSQGAEKPAALTAASPAKSGTAAAIGAGAAKSAAALPASSGTQEGDKAAESNTIVIEDDSVTRMEQAAADEAAPPTATRDESDDETSSTISGFVTVQSFANFSAMAGGITMAWSVLMGVNDVFRGIWVPMVAALIWAFVSLGISWRGLKTNAFRAQAAFIGVFNALVLASAVMGVHAATMR